MYCLYKFERLIQLNHVRDCVNIVSSKSDHDVQNLQIEALDVIDDILLTDLDRNVEKRVQEIDKLRVSFLIIAMLREFVQRRSS